MVITSEVAYQYRSEVCCGVALPTEISAYMLPWIETVRQLGMFMIKEVNKLFKNGVQEKDLNSCGLPYEGSLEGPLGHWPCY